MQLHGVHGTWGRTVTEVFRDVELPLEWHKELADYCKKVGIDFSTSPYNKEAVDLCAEMNLPFIKIGSGEITWLEMLEKRNDLTHIYDGKKARELANLIIEKYVPEFEKLKCCIADIYVDVLESL